MLRPEKLWTRPFIALTLSMLGVGFTFYLLVPTMAGYAVAEFGASESAAGFASSSFFFGALIARLFAGRALVRQGVRRVVVASLTGLMLSCLAYLLPATLASTLVIRIVHGVFFGFTATALANGAMSLAPASRRGEASGWFMLGLTVATGFAPFAALALINSGAGQGMVFVVTAVCGAIALASAASVAARLPGRPEHPPGGAPSGLAALIDPKAVPIGAVVGLCALTYATVLAYLNLFAADKGVSKVGHGRMGLGVSSYFLLVDFGTGLGPILLAGLITLVGYSGTFVAASAIPILALALYYLLARRVPNAPDDL